ncbi:transglycosylase domain-containing protein [Nocardiopsis sp. RSe5-2]|uniref:Transglycosylase domain-containing protein n=1 Tax=Nocardiopsis endophytica TaxID=3018445 RepID=A0ABT4TX83_9ACTN|nr:transglycosylase domain-containing protein [Nocardiopsis endophytica]MDA2809312.1 transglycosylase domain-containing protein [Nocardiopsis endophytica]
MVQRIAQLFGVGVIAGILVAALALPAVGGIGITARNVATGFMNMPSDLETPPPPQRSTIYDREGGVIAEIYDKNRELVDLEDMSPVMQDAIISIEDSGFYEHGGIDIGGTFRAALRTLAGSTQGGSSLTQQYVKNVLVESADNQDEQEEATETSIARKLRELRYALTLEKRMTKDEILQGYLNIAYFGDGAYGVESAAQHFFGKKAADLELSEAATLAGAVRYPYLYNMRLNTEDAQDRRDVVLDRMVQIGRITEEEAAEAKAADLEDQLDVSNPSNGCVPSDQPFFCDYVVQEIEKSERFGENETERARWLRTAGLEIHTTLDADMQEAAQDAVDKYVPRKNKSKKVAAEILIEPGTGEIRGMAQSRNYGPDESKLGETSINFTTDSDRGGSTGFQAGSTFKAFALAAALEQGKGFGTSYSGANDSSTTITGNRNCDGGTLAPWTLSNAGDTKGGGSSMVAGTKGSVNTYFAHLQRDVGLCNVIEMAENLGVKRADGQSFDNPHTQANNSFVLGSEEVSPLRVANAYATFASGGTYCEPQAITSIEDKQAGKTIEIESECERRISEDVAAGVSYLLQQTFKGGTTTGLGIGRPAAAKTGTTDGSAAAWFAGYTPNLAGSVFVGDPRGPQNYPLRGVNLGGRYYGTVYGATIPGPIWQETMREATEELPEKGFPSAPSKYRGGGSGAPDAEQTASGASVEGGVPDVVGQSEGQAVAALEEAGYVVSVSGTRVRSDEAEGTVAAVNPDPGTVLPEGATVNVFLSTGSSGRASPSADAGDGDGGGRGGSGDRGPDPGVGTHPVVPASEVPRREE